jgi:hypothetical protein
VIQDRLSMRRFARWLVLLGCLLGLALFAPHEARAELPLPPADATEGAGVPGDDERPPVRTGTAEEEIPAAPSASPDPSDPRHAPPGDAPVLRDSGIQLPKPPAGFNLNEDAGWIRFAYLPAVRERIQPLITQADDVRAELTHRLGYPVLRKVTVYVARTPGEMATLAPEGAPFPKYAAGVAYPQLGLVLLTIHPVHPGSRHELGEVFRHELAHIALHDAVRGRHVPRWFNEGFAVHASGEGSFARLQTLWTATLADDLLPLEKMERSFPRDDVGASVAYAQAADVVRFLVRQQEQHRFRAMIERIRDGQEFDTAMRDAYGMDLANLEYEWRADVARRYTFWPVFFSGGFVWAGEIALFVWGWRRRRKKNKETLERWAREEAAEDRRRREAETAPRVHIVFARASQRVPDVKPATPSEVEIPKVEHDGLWHTLH